MPLERNFSELLRTLCGVFCSIIFPMEFRGQSIEGLKVEKFESRGRRYGLRTSRDVALSEVLLGVSRPLVSVLDVARLKDTCSECLSWSEQLSDAMGHQTPSGKLSVCNGCRVVSYCSKSCQVKNWRKYHKYECKIFKSLLPKVLPTAVRAILRLLLLKDAQVLSEDEWGAFMDLESHLVLFNQEIQLSLQLATLAAQAYSATTIDQGTIFRMFGILKINAFTLSSPTFEPLGIALHPLPALINHSCFPNAVIRFGKGGMHMQVIPLQALAKGEEILISYVDTTLPYDLRVREIHEGYHFHCDCFKCFHKDKDNIEKFLDGKFLQDRHSEMANVLIETCARVAHLLKHANKAAAEGSLPEESAAAAEDLTPTSEATARDPVTLLKEALGLLRQTRIWPVYRYPSKEVHHQLMLAYINEKKFTLAFIHCAITVIRIDPQVFVYEHDPLRMLHKWTFIRLIQHILTTTSLPGQLTLQDMYYWKIRATSELKSALDKQYESDFANVVRKKMEQEELAAASHLTLLRDADPMMMEKRLNEAMDEVS